MRSSKEKNFYKLTEQVEKSEDPEKSDLKSFHSILFPCPESYMCSTSSQNGVTGTTYLEQQTKFTK